jgi:hypothetical protein
MSVIYSAFNSMLIDFFSDLAESFPDYAIVSESRDMLRQAVSLNEKASHPLETFAEVFEPHKELIQAKDDTLFRVCKLPYMTSDEFDMSRIWQTLSEDNRDVIWAYLQQLFMLAHTATSMTPAMLRAVESMANNTLSKVKSNEMSAEDAQNPMKLMAEVMKDPDMMASFNS